MKELVRISTVCAISCEGGLSPTSDKRRRLQPISGVPIRVDFGRFTRFHVAENEHDALAAGGLAFHHSVIYVGTGMRSCQWGCWRGVEGVLESVLMGVLEGCQWCVLKVC